MGSEISGLLDQARVLKAKGGRFDDVECSFEPPASEDDLVELSGVCLDELRAFLSISNGACLLDLEILPIKMQIEIPEYYLRPFHSWGNGDFDCIVTGGGRYEPGSVVFTNHSPEVTVLIAKSFTQWLQGVIEEAKQSGEVLHPMDYSNHKREGMYSHVLAALKGVDCELNR